VWGENFETVLSVTVPSVKVPSATSAKCDGVSVKCDGASAV
jgi:hypothetical protein